MSDVPRVAIFVPSLRGGGAERSMLNVADGLGRRGVGVDLVLAQAEGPYLADVPPHVRLVDLGAPRVLRSLPRLVRYFRSERPGVVLSALNHANVVALWARRLAGAPARAVVSERNTLSVAAGPTPGMRSRLLIGSIRRFYPWADAVICNSQGVADDLIAATGLPPELMRVIYNPVVRPEIAERARQAVDHPWFATPGPPVVLAVGRFRKQKDFATLIRAFARVRLTTEARLLILGEGSERPDLEALVRELALDDDVDLPGFAPNPYAYMARASLFVLSSRWEGLPTVLIEALSCGVPVVATDCPSGPREILEDGKYGELVPVGGLEALAEAIGRGLAGDVPRPTPESWQRFELETVVDQYLAVMLGTERCAG